MIPGDVSSTFLSHCLVFRVLSVISRRWPLLSTPLHFDMHQSLFLSEELYCRKEWAFSQLVSQTQVTPTLCPNITIEASFKTSNFQIIKQIYLIRTVKPFIKINQEIVCWREISAYQVFIYFFINLFI